MYNVKYLLNLLHVQYKTASQVIFKFQNTIHIEMQNANHRERTSCSTLDVQQICLGGDLACPVYGPLQYWGSPARLVEAVGICYSSLTSWMWLKEQTWGSSRISRTKLVLCLLHRRENDYEISEHFTYILFI